jgi:hypothetical protein
MEDAGFTVASDAARDVSPKLFERLRESAPAIGQAAIAAIDEQSAEHAPKPKERAPEAGPETGDQNKTQEAT